MKIVHMNTHAYGGAAVVARRLHRAALADGLQSTLITKYGLRSDRTPEYLPLCDARLLYRLRAQTADGRLYRAGKLVQRWAQHRNLAGRPAGHEVFSPLNTQTRFADCAARFDPDVIHLHWIAGFVDSETFVARNRTRKFVWTLHDMNPLTGGCHHADGCTGFTASCSRCPQLEGTRDPEYASQVLAAKARSLALLRADQVTIAAPSRWLLELSMQSRLLRRFRHVYIENPALEFEAASRPVPELRLSLGLPAQKKIVLFVSDNLRNPRKGVDLLFAAARRLPQLSDILLVGVGQRTDAPSGVPVLFAGRASDERILARWYACADVVVHPAVAENASLVIIEALRCGTPVVAFAAGGTPELVTPACGELVAERSADRLADAIHDVLFHRRFSRQQIRMEARKYAPEAVHAKYRAVYHELLAGSRVYS